ncbi:MAG: hypothetical protein U0838_17600 [Chloroflexota bacterium]
MPDVAGDTIAAGFYVSNMRFAIRATDYLNSTLPPSPILHFWSLGVEEQFYFFWPAMLALVAGAAHRLGNREVGLRRIGITLGIVFIASLGFEIWADRRRAAVGVLLAAGLRLGASPSAGWASLRRRWRRRSSWAEGRTLARLGGRGADRGRGLPARRHDGARARPCSCRRWARRW